MLIIGVQLLAYFVLFVCVCLYGVFSDLCCAAILVVVMPTDFFSAIKGEQKRL